MKNRNLYQFHVQLEQSKGNIFHFLLKDKIKTFYKLNGQRLEVLTNTLQKLQEEFFVMENDVIKVIKKESDTEPGLFNDVPVMKEGKNYDDYIVKHDELLNMDCVIKF